jgi:hypothetical protein
MSCIPVSNISFATAVLGCRCFFTRPRAQESYYALYSWTFLEVLNHIAELKLLLLLQHQAYIACSDYAVYKRAYH